MTSVIMIAPLNAANFESGNATDGQVLTADGAGGTAFEDAAGGSALDSIDPRFIMVVSGAGSPVNDSCVKSGNNELGPIWSGLGGTGVTIYKQSGWMADTWVIDRGGTVYYRGEDAATPDLVTSWTTEAGINPSPTVLAASGPQSYGKTVISDGQGGYAWSSLPLGSLDASTASLGQVPTKNELGVEWQAPAGGVTGSFATADGKTVNVVNGLVTAMTDPK